VAIKRLGKQTEQEMERLGKGKEIDPLRRKKTG
jgi:hypothetical protein